MKSKLLVIALSLTLLLLSSMLASANISGSIGGGIGSGGLEANASVSAVGGSGSAASNPSSSGSGGGGGSSSSSSGGGSSGGSSGSSSKPVSSGGGTFVPEGKVLVVLDPQKQVSDSQKVTFRVIIMDFHKEPGEYTYQLDFSSKMDGVNGSFSQNSISLDENSKRSVELTIYRNEKVNSIVFEVAAKNSERSEYSSTKGLWLTTTNTEPTTPPTESAMKFFEGKGFITSKTKEGLGSIIFLNLLLGIDNSLRGNIKLENGEVYKVTGKVEEKNIKLEGESPKNGNRIQLSGTVVRYNTFAVLKGDLDYIEGDIIYAYDLTALSENVIYFKKIEFENEKEEKTVTVAPSENQVVTITTSEQASTSTSGTVSAEQKAEYNIVTKGIESKKFLWIFPTSENVAKVEIISDGKVYEKTLEANKEVKVGNIAVKVSSDIKPGKELEFSIKEIA